MNVYLLNGLLGLCRYVCVRCLTGMACVAGLPAYLLLSQFYQCLFLLGGHP